MNNLTGIDIYYSPYIPYGKGFYVPGIRTVFFSSAPKPSRWARFKAWLRR